MFKLTVQTETSKVTENFAVKRETEEQVEAFKQQVREFAIPGSTWSVKV